MLAGCLAGVIGIGAIVASVYGLVKPVEQEPAGTVGPARTAEAGHGTLNRPVPVEAAPWGDTAAAGTAATHRVNPGETVAPIPAERVAEIRAAQQERLRRDLVENRADDLDATLSEEEIAKAAQEGLLIW